jgi:alkylation response protein AidB-like acyl-CoA dehydrogenase
VQHQRWEPDAAAASDRALLSSFAELGWFGLGLPEAAGGVGFTATEEALLFREAGRFLVTPVLLANVIAARVATAAGDAALAEQIVAGTARCGLAIPAAAGQSYLIDTDGADYVLLLAPEEISILPAGGFKDAKTLHGVDGTVVLQSAARQSGEAVAAVTGVAAAEIAEYLSLLVAAMLVGSAEAVRDMTVAHASERMQFGQKIGTFQAVSHPCADMALRCEAALSQTKMASIVVRDARADHEFQVRAARIVAFNAATANASASIQLHGGMGFAAEYPVHFHLKRALLLDKLCGALSSQLDDFLGLPYPDR